MTRAGKNTTLMQHYVPDYAEKIDGRSKLAKAIRERTAALTADLGGREALSHQQFSLCRRAVWLETLLDHEESRIAQGDGVDIPDHARLVNSLLAVYRALGLKRQARDITLHDVLRKVERGKA